MTRVSPKSFCAVLALNALCGGAIAAPAAGPVPIYDPTQIAFNAYTVVERIGIQNWRSAFGIPGHATEDAARNAVLARAAQVGADGITNLRCMSQTDALFKRGGFYCYANAIRLNSERRL